MSGRSPDGVWVGSVVVGGGIRAGRRVDRRAGGLRKRVRLEAVRRFEGGRRTREIAAALRVSERSVERRRRQWRSAVGRASARRVHPGARGRTRSK
ncbi:helix-turn-helix domain-containing protein [Streptomyces sp. NPDC102274]|uniref:helix-turn-helix domain-containing protein n=1 Tax=Streptomyces sp. NPDC102274 TaxID=3366151 RepID=UPI00380EECF3